MKEWLLIKWQGAPLPFSQVIDFDIMPFSIEPSSSYNQALKACFRIHRSSVD